MTMCTFVRGVGRRVDCMRVGFGRISYGGMTLGSGEGVVDSGCSR